jgi:DNA invertase Pin-like site-specific DNA recombinase
MTIYLGYARVSTEQQSLDLQYMHLTPICERIWTEKRSGMTINGRTELVSMITEAKRLRSEGADVCIVVYSLSRLGRRMIETVALIEDLRACGIAFRSLSESIDTSNAMGRCFMNILASLGQMEAELISERTKAGLQARKEAGIKLGPKTLENTDAVNEAIALIAAGASVRNAAKQVGISNSTLLRRLNVA